MDVADIQAEGPEAVDAAVVAHLTEVARWESLTSREADVALRLAFGERNRDIATALGISQKTVDTHRAHLLRKLGCRHNVDLCRLTIRLGKLEA